MTPALNASEPLSGQRLTELSGGEDAQAAAIVRQRLLEAASRGRKRVPRPLVNPVVDRRGPPIAPGLVCEDLELLCELQPSSQSWLPLRILFQPTFLTQPPPFPPHQPPHPLWQPGTTCPTEPPAQPPTPPPSAAASDLVGGSAATLGHTPRTNLQPQPAAASPALESLPEFESLQSAMQALGRAPLTPGNKTDSHTDTGPGGVGDPSTTQDPAAPVPALREHPAPSPADPRNPVIQVPPWGPWQPLGAGPADLCDNQALGKGPGSLVDLMMTGQQEGSGPGARPGHDAATSAPPLPDTLAAGAQQAAVPAAATPAAAVRAGPLAPATQVTVSMRSIAPDFSLQPLPLQQQLAHGLVAASDSVHSYVASRAAADRSSPARAALGPRTVVDAAAAPEQPAAPLTGLEARGSAEGEGVQELAVEPGSALQSGPGPGLGPGAAASGGVLDMAKVMSMTSRELWSTPPPAGAHCHAATPAAAPAAAAPLAATAAAGGVPGSAVSLPSSTRASQPGVPQGQQGCSAAAGSPCHLPVVVLVHCTGSSLMAMREHQEEFAARGYFTVAVDSRYHGERAKSEGGRQKPRDIYQDALCRAWRDGVERPYLLDTVWDLLHLVDYLVTRPEVDPKRIGITGVSLGGMHAWLAAVADPRLAAVAPIMGVQGWLWAVEHDSWQGRVDSVPQVFRTAAQDLGKTEVDSAVVCAVWQRLTSGLLDVYDAPLSLPALCPRPLLVVTGATDERCPLPGILQAWPCAQAAYLRHAQATLQCKEQQQQCQAPNSKTAMASTGPPRTLAAPLAGSVPCGPGAAAAMVSNAEAQALELAHLGEPVRLAASAGAAFVAQWRREALEASTTAGAAAEAALQANLAVLAAGDAAKAAHIAVKVAAAAANAAQQAHACEANPEVLGNETSSGGRSGADVTSDSQSSPSAESSGLAADDPEQRALLRAIRLAELQAASDAAAAALQRAIDQAAAADAQVETAKTTVVTRTAEARVADAKYRACAAALTAVNERLQLYVEPGVGHVETPGMWLAVRLFFDKYLLQRQVQGQAAHSAVQRNVQASLVIGSCDA